MPGILDPKNSKNPWLKKMGLSELLCDNNCNIFCGNKENNGVIEMEFSNSCAQRREDFHQ